MKYFTQEEFRGWYDSMSCELLVKLDLFRLHWEAPVIISPAPGALGREGDSLSQHNYKRWGELRAVDVMPVGLDSQQAAFSAYEVAKQCGFTGIGFYPHWKPSPGLHLDVRDSREIGTPALWGALKNDEGEQVYVSMAKAIRAFRS